MRREKNNAEIIKIVHDIKYSNIYLLTNCNLQNLILESVMASYSERGTFKSKCEPEKKLD